MAARDAEWMGAIHSGLKGRY
ncbi:MAG: hypothetical protein ACLURV_13925 [Gallintestinimicrobium sp.]